MIFLAVQPTVPHHGKLLNTSIPADFVTFIQYVAPVAVELTEMQHRHGIELLVKSPFSYIERAEGQDSDASSTGEQGIM